MNDKPFIERVSANKPAWADTQIEPWSRVGYRQAEDFITRHYWTDRGALMCSVSWAPTTRSMPG